MGADHDFGTAAGFGIAVVCVLANEFEITEADDERLWRLQSFVGFFVLSLLLFEVGLELGEGVDWHGARVGRGCWENVQALGIRHLALGRAEKGDWRFEISEEERIQQEKGVKG